MENIILSICIPTCNGGERLEKLVKHILKTNRTDIEIAISDNCSTDNTKERICKIDDNRVHFYENEENIGALENGIRALVNGQGEYLMLLIDRDIVQVDCMDEYVDFLRKGQYDVIINQAHLFHQNFGCELTRDRKYYYMFKAPHPSYFTFKKSAFDKVEFTEAIKKNGYYPALIGMNIVQHGGKVYLNSKIPILLECELSYVSMHGSRSWNILGKINLTDLKNGSFEPECQMGRLEEYLDYIAQTCKDEENEDAILAIYMVLLENTLDYKNVMESGRTRFRYNVRDLHYEMKQYVELADIFFDRFLTYARKKKITYRREVVELITELLRLQFINSAVSQLQTDFDKNEKRIAEIKESLQMRGLCEDVAVLKQDMNLQAGIGNTES